MGVFSSLEAKVIKPISDLIWEWYGAGDTSRIKSVFELGNVLMLLALTPEQKVETIPDCPCCELIGQYSGTDTFFLALCADKVDVKLIQKLKDLSHKAGNPFWLSTSFRSRMKKGSCASTISCSARVLIKRSISLVCDLRLASRLHIGSSIITSFFAKSGSEFTVAIKKANAKVLLSPSPHFKQCPSGLVPFLFKHRLREP